MIRPILFLIAGLSGPASLLAGPVEDFVGYHENVMGTSLEVRLRGDSAAAARAEEAVLGEIDRLSAIFSGHDPSSEVRRWQAGPKAPAAVSPELFEVLDASRAWISKTGGAFDPRVEVFSRLWSAASKEDRRPDDSEIAPALALLNSPGWRLDPDARTAERLTDAPIGLNAIAKGYIIEKAAEVALRPGSGITGVLLNVGGDVRVRGDLTASIGVASPFDDSETSAPLATVEVRNRWVATSGFSKRGFSIRGRHYSHIIDPRTGLPADRVAGATVIADRVSDVYGLSTALNVLEPTEGLRLVDSPPGVAALIVSKDGAVFRSARWARVEKPVELAMAPPAAQEPRAKGSKPAWNPDFEMLIKFEINKPGGNDRRYRRPYVAIWAEDKDGFPVRTVSLWVQQRPPGPRWYPDLKLWYRGDKVRKLADGTDLIATVSKATRNAGQYEVIWDGLDDHGKPVAAGDYTIFIEAAREHGTYQVIRQPVKVAEAPFAEELKGNVEIKTASIAYRRKGSQGPAPGGPARP